MRHLLHLVCLPVVILSGTFASLPALADAINPDALAATGDYKENPDTHKPTEATTSFIMPNFAKPENDPGPTATHELIHAIGFTDSYQLYRDHLMEQDGLDKLNDRARFNEKTDFTGNAIAYMIINNLSTRRSKTNHQ